MINKDRIIPIEKTDYLSLIATVLNLINDDKAVIVPVVEGKATIPDTSGVVYLVSEPATEIDMLGSQQFKFVPAHDFKGFSADGVAVEPADGSDEVIADGVSLYNCYYASSDFMVVCLTPQAE